MEGSRQLEWANIQSATPGESWDVIRTTAERAMMQGEVWVEIDGRNYAASYDIEDGSITVTTGHGVQKSMVHGMDHDDLARSLLHEIISEAKLTPH